MDYKKLTSKEVFHIDLSLDRIRKALEILGNPQNELRCIHTAGTNGKGSVCAATASILQEAGYKVGLYTSPHIWEYTERIRINGEEISKQDFAKYAQKVFELDIPLTEFEVLTVIMFMYFKDNNIDIAVIETGMGGRFDATNVIEKNLCAVITHIDLDHTERLGDTKEKIAFEKAGIIKPNCPVFTSENYEAIRNKAKESNSLLIFVSPKVDKKYKETFSLKGVQQEENLALVLSVIKYVFNDISENIILKGLEKVLHPCRFEYFPDKNLIVDASHNPNGIEALRRNLDIYYPNHKRRFVFGCLRNKDYARMMKILFCEGDEVYINEFDYPNACTFEELKTACPVEVQRYKDEKVLTPDKLNIICGSFYMIGEIPKLKKPYRTSATSLWSSSSCLISETET